MSLSSGSQNHFPKPSSSNDGPDLLFGAAGDVSILYPVASAAPSISPLAITTRIAAPQYVEPLSGWTATLSSPSSQPPVPTSFGIPSLSNLPVPTTVIAPLTYVSALSSGPAFSLSSTGTALVVMSSPIPSTATISSFSPEITPLAVMPVSTTSTSPSPSSTSSEDNSSSNRAPFYVGVILGTIVAIGFFAAMIAWIVRLRLHARRRRAAAAVPWATYQNDDALEEGHDVTYIGQPIDRIGSKDISSQDAIPWEPRGDRDVGEPKRSNSYVHGSVHSSQASDPFTDNHVLAESVAYPLPIYHSYATHDSYQDADGSLDGHRSASTLGPLQVANMTPGDTSAASSRTSTALGMNRELSGSGEHEYGTPQENQAGSRPPFLALDGEGLHVPWTQKRRRLGSSESWDRLPTPAEPQAADAVVAEDDSWTASLRSNLTQAFNAVAASLPAGAALMRDGGEADSDDILTHRPQQHSVRRSIRSSLYGVEYSEKALSRNDSVASKSWTLEERDDGTGTVHFHGYGTPDLSTPDSHPFIITRQPQSALLRPDAYHGRGSRYSRGNQRQPSMRSTMSSCSLYSMASGVSGATSTSAPRLPEFSRHSTMKIKALEPVAEKREDSVMEGRPRSLVSRSSSSGCSFSYYFGAGAAGDVTETEEAVHQSITDRRKRLRRVV